MAMKYSKMALIPLFISFSSIYFAAKHLFGSPTIYRRLPIKAYYPKKLDLYQIQSKTETLYVIDTLPSNTDDIEEHIASRLKPDIDAVEVSPTLAEWKYESAFGDGLSFKQEYLLAACNKSSQYNTNESVNINIKYAQDLRSIGLEPTELHEFKSIYIIDPVVYKENQPLRKAPGRRKTKVISCFNCPRWYFRSNIHAYNRDFKRCPYSECTFDSSGHKRNESSLLLFFPTPSWMPPRPPGQLWAFCSWESPYHYGYPARYSLWKDAFNWTYSYRQDADMFAPNNIFAWRASDLLLTDAQYMEIAASKTRTAAWFVSNCKTVSKRMQYVEEMAKYLDIDIYGYCTKRGCGRSSYECSQMLNHTYKFYLAFENSLCTDYVTEKLFRNFQDRIQIIPVVRGGFDYHEHIPPNTLVDASAFADPIELSLYLKDLSDDLPRYAAMLKEKDRLTVLNRKLDWCDVCEKLHKETTSHKHKVIDDIKQWSHNGTCWNASGHCVCVWKNRKVYLSV